MVSLDGGDCTTEPRRWWNIGPAGVTFRIKAHCRTHSWSSRLRLSKSHHLFCPPCFIVIRARFLVLLLLLLFLWAICLSAETLFSIRLFIFGTQLTPGEPLFSCLFVLHKSHCVQYLIMCCWITHLCLFSLFEDAHCWRIVSHFAAVNRLV